MLSSLITAGHFISMLCSVWLEITTLSYDRLFEKFPDVQDLFVPFRGLNSEELRQNVGLREHGLRVMGTIEKCVTRIDQPDKLTSMLEILGEKHVVFDTKIEYFDVSYMYLWTLIINPVTWRKLIVWTQRSSIMT